MSVLLDIHPTLALIRPSILISAGITGQCSPIARDFAVSLDAVQRQLDRFVKSGTLVCKGQGRTLVNSWNPKSRLAARLRDLTGVIDDASPPR